MAIECAGKEAALNACVDAVRPRGTVVLEAGLHVVPAVMSPETWAFKDITIEATWCYGVTDWPRVIRLIGRGLLPVERIITAQLGFEEIVPKATSTDSSTPPATRSRSSPARRPPERHQEESTVRRRDPADPCGHLIRAVPRVVPRGGARRSGPVSGQPRFRNLVGAYPAEGTHQGPSRDSDRRRST